MKLKFIFLLPLLCLFVNGFSQQIAVKARYTSSRLVDDTPNPPKRENRLILSFFEVNPSGVYMPVSLSNYDLWVFKAGSQYGSLIGGVNDSAGNNYEGYTYTAPKAVAYFNSLGLNYIDCDPNAATHYIINGHELDCGYVTVSYYDMDYGTGNLTELFTAPNVCLPYYGFGDPNFNWPVPPGPPYNWYSSNCGGGTTSFVIRGVLPSDSGSAAIILPVVFANVKGVIDIADIATISWSNMTETDVAKYEVELSSDGISFQSAGTVLPTGNTGGRADYKFSSLQREYKNYYRVKAIELNGNHFYSTIISLTKTTKAPVFSIYPNPVINGILTVQLTDAAADRYMLSIISSTHQFLRQKLIDHRGGALNYQYDLTGLPKGVYQLVLQSNRQRHSQRLIYIN